MKAALPLEGSELCSGLSSHLILPLGLIYREHLEKSVMGKGEMQNDNPNTQKVLGCLQLVNFTNKDLKKKKKRTLFPTVIISVSGPGGGLQACTAKQGCPVGEGGGGWRVEVRWVSSDRMLPTKARPQ